MRKEESCYACKHRGDLPGSAHSRCNVLRETGSEIVSTLEMLIGIGEASISNKNTGESLVKLNPHGVKNGWAAWPINFDPVWVDECQFFLKKEGK